MRLLVTDGSGLIGTNYVDYTVSNSVDSIINIDIKPHLRKNIIVISMNAI